MNLDNMAKIIHQNSADKGFWEPNTKENHTVFYLKQIARMNKIFFNSSRLEMHGVLA